MGENVSEECLLKHQYGIGHEDLRMLGKAYLLLQRKRQASLQSLRKSGSEILEWLTDELTRLKNQIVQRAWEALQGHPLQKWVNNVAGLGPTALLLYSAFINPHIAGSPAKVYGYWGLNPEGKRRKDRKMRGNPKLKKNAWYLAQIVIYKKDSYYYPLFRAKREYLLTRTKTEGEATGRATYWLAKILLGNAWEKMREGCMLSGCQHKHPYIEPKPTPTATPPAELLEIIKRGERKEYPEKT